MELPNSAFHPSCSWILEPLVNVTGKCNDTRSCLSSTELEACWCVRPEARSTTDASARSMAVELNVTVLVSSRMSRLRYYECTPDRKQNGKNAEITYSMIPYPQNLDASRSVLKVKS